MLRITIAGITIESDSPITAKLPDGTCLAFAFPEGPKAAIPEFQEGHSSRSRQEAYSSSGDFSAVLKAIEAAGPSGISRRALLKDLSISYHRLHYILSTLTTKGQIAYIKSGGPSRNRWVLPEHAGNVQEGAEKAQEGKNLLKKSRREKSRAAKEILAALEAAGSSGMTVENMQENIPDINLATIYTSLHRLCKNKKIQKVRWPYERNHYYYANDVSPEPPASRVEGKAPKHKWPSIIINAAKTFVQRFTTEELYNHLNKSVSQYAICKELKASSDFRIFSIGPRKSIVWEQVNANNS